MKEKKSKWVGKRKLGPIKPMLFPFPETVQTHRSPTDLPARKEHNAVPPQLLNADPLIIGTETIADVIINDVEACALLDSGATADLMTLAYAESRNFDTRPMTELSDRFVNIRLAAGFKTTLSGYVEYNLQIPGIPSYNLDQVALVAEDDTPFSREVPLTIENRRHHP